MVPFSPNSPPENLALQHVLDNVLSIPEDSPVRSAFPQFWIFTIHDLMNAVVHEDLQAEFSHATTVDDLTIHTHHHLPPMLLRNIVILQQWFKSSDPSSINIWFTLYEPAFIAWKRLVFHEIPVSPITTTSTPIVTTLPSALNPSEATIFQRSIKQIPLTTPSSRMIIAGSNGIVILRRL